MTSSNIESKRGVKVFVIVFCVVFLVLLIIVAFISWPKEDAVNIYQKGQNSLTETSKKWFLLEKNSYEIINEYDEYVTTDSNFLTPVRYYYFNVLVTDSKGESFIMAVRTDKKTKELRSGNAVSLYGMAKPLNEERKEKQIQSLKNYENNVEICSVSLFDNNDTVQKRKVEAVLAAFATILDLILIMFFIYKR